MSLTAEDLWPLVQKMSREEQLRLARRALASVGYDATAYARRPVRDEELSGGDDEDPLAWEGEGWDGL